MARNLLPRDNLLGFLGWNRFGDLRLEVKNQRGMGGEKITSWLISFGDGARFLLLTLGPP
jgi:hypothetical protein